MDGHFIIFRGSWLHIGYHYENLGSGRPDGLGYISFSVFYPVKIAPSGPIYQHGLSVIPEWISNYMHYKLGDEIIDPIPELQRYHRWGLGMDK